MKKDSGITIIILVLTIIIMLILSGVAIYGLQETGVLDSAAETVEKTNDKTKKDEKVARNIDQSWIEDEPSPAKSPTKVNSSDVLGASGTSPLTIEQSTGDNLVSYKIYGKTTRQSGTPSMTSPKTIQSVGELVTNTSDSNYGKYKIPVIATDEQGVSVTTNIYLNEPLRSTNDAVDYIDFSTQKCYRNVAELVFNGTET